MKRTNHLSIQETLQRPPLRRAALFGCALLGMSGVIACNQTDAWGDLPRVTAADTAAATGMLEQSYATASPKEKYLKHYIMPDVVIPKTSGSGPLGLIDSIDIWTEFTTDAVMLRGAQTCLANSAYDITPPSFTEQPRAEFVPGNSTDSFSIVSRVPGNVTLYFSGANGTIADLEPSNEASRRLLQENGCSDGPT